MCTISFIPKENGFYLGMNRDESRSRPKALPPEIRTTSTGFSIYPSEPGGGTWIGMNDSGLCLALINWYKVPARTAGRIVTRGIIVRELLSVQTAKRLFGLLRELPLEAMPPFRLISVSFREPLVKEYRWDQTRLRRVDHLWAANHWFSSGLDQQMAENVRAEVCRQAWKQSDAGSLGWLRRLHRSHLPDRFSICMHRKDALTVSYTEIAVCDAVATMRYHSGPLCANDGHSFARTFLFCRNAKRLMNHRP
jgi:Transport and Golgi organisation 2